jgi:hypothetical protein
MSSSLSKDTHPDSAAAAFEMKANRPVSSLALSLSNRRTVLDDHIRRKNTRSMKSKFTLHIFRPNR